MRGTCKDLESLGGLPSTWTETVHLLECGGSVGASPEDPRARPGPYASLETMVLLASASSGLDMRPSSGILLELGAGVLFNFPLL